MSTNPFSENPFSKSSADPSADFGVFFDVLFDIRFTRFITTTWISIIWVFVIVLHFLALGGGVIGLALWSNAAQSSHYVTEPPFWLWFVLPIAVAFSLLGFRMSLELMIVIFRIEANTRVAKEYYSRVMKEKKYELDSY